MAKTLFSAIFQSLRWSLCTYVCAWMHHFTPWAACIIKKTYKQLQRCSSQSIGFLWTPHLREPYQSPVLWLGGECDDAGRWGEVCREQVTAGLVSVLTYTLTGATQGFSFNYEHWQTLTLQLQHCQESARHCTNAMVALWCGLISPSSMPRSPSANPHSHLSKGAR